MESDFSAERDRERTLDERLDALREELSGLRIDEERMRERVLQQSRAAADNSTRIQGARRDIEANSVRILGLEADVLQERNRIERLASETNAAALRLEAKESDCAEREAAMSEKREAQEACRTRLMQSLRELSNSRLRLGTD